MKPQDLLYHLNSLETGLANFSFEELNTDESIALKESFLVFKNSLECKIFGDDLITYSEFDSKQVYKRSAIAENQIVENTISQAGNNSQEQLIANVSHEIRTPLNGIIGFTELLKESELGVEQESQVEAIQSASENLLRIINELLDYSKLCSGKVNHELIDFNLHMLVNDVLYLCNTLIIDKRVVLQLDMGLGISKVLLGDPGKLSQILLNLIGNAIKFVKEGNILLKITAKKKTTNDIVLQFDVIDTGICISKSSLKHIFDPFGQAEYNTHLKYEGTGLGLSIVKQIIQHLNGQITVSSILGEGTTFSCTIPYAISATTNLPTPKDNLLHDTYKKNAKNMRVLVFEDNALNKKLIEEQLKTWGCIGFITDDPEEGLSILRSNSIDIILMDLRMPIMNGFQMAQLIRNTSDKIISTIPIVAVSADFTSKDKEQLNRSGINDFILKPYKHNTLLSLLIKNKKNMEIKQILDSKNTKPNDINTPTKKLNLSSVLEDCMGDITLLEELVRLYKENALEFMGKVSLHLKNNDMVGMQFATHKIKPGLSMMKTYDLHSIVVQMHRTATTDKDSKHLKFLYNCFIEEYPLVVNAIDEGVRKIRNKRK